ncbi:hypothetical protein [Burkholderia sp. ABCPW 14]|uniref:hypothetical protein n=1 Tax=Burkholderia sp. ABCPW 14 TaxID=1637860 RepID=UPI003FA47B86
MRLREPLQVQVREIAQLAAEAMHEHDRRTFAVFDVVQAVRADVDELAFGREHLLDAVRREQRECNEREGRVNEKVEQLDYHWDHLPS